MNNDTDTAARTFAGMTTAELERVLTVDADRWSVEDLALAHSIWTGRTTTKARDIEHLIIRRARAEGRSWAWIGETWGGITRQAAHERWSHLENLSDDY